jgi:hypothetical protein
MATAPSAKQPKQTARTLPGGALSSRDCWGNPCRMSLRARVVPKAPGSTRRGRVCPWVAHWPVRPVPGDLMLARSVTDLPTGDAWVYQPKLVLSQSPAVPALTGSQEFDLEGHPLLFRTIGGADGALATIVHVPDLQTICSGDVVYNNIHMWADLPGSAFYMHVDARVSALGWVGAARAG